MESADEDDELVTWMVRRRVLRYACERVTIELDPSAFRFCGDDPDEVEDGLSEAEKASRADKAERERRFAAVRGGCR